MPTGKLAGEGKKLWEEIYQKALKGSCKNDQECAARTAWHGIEGAGWKKDANGEWHKSEVFSEFSMRIDRASYDKISGERRVRIVASDTEEDIRKDSMSLELFTDFVDRIKSGEVPPPDFTSDFWRGGEPYISVSHYDDMNGKGVPGMIDTTYVDGSYLKSKGKFNDTPLGRKCFEAVCSDLYGETKDRPDKVRVSIAFLDYMHKHKSNGYVYDRLNSEKMCPECFLEIVNGESKGKVFLKGHLIHEALTRVPVNTRTSMEVDKSMADKILTRKDDASSIVGEDEAENLEELESKIVGKSEVLVTRSDEEVVEKATGEIATKPRDECVDPVTGEKIPGCEPKHREDEKPMTEEQHPDRGQQQEPKRSEVDVDVIRSIIKEVLSETKSETKITPETVPSHPLDTLFSEFKSRFDEIINSEVAEDMKLQMVQEPFDSLGHGVVSVVKSSIKPKVVTPEVNGQTDLINAFSQAMQPFSQKLDLLLTQLATPAVERAMPQIPQRRSISPEIAQKLIQQPVVSKSETPHLRAIIDKTV